MTPGQTSALATIRDIRKRAETRGFAFADRLYADDDGLSMATSPGLVTVHAMLLASTGRPVLDIAAGCAIEALQLAATGLNVTCYEIDPARAHFATINADDSPRPSATENWNWLSIRLLTVFDPARNAPKAPTAGAKNG